ncbi:radical SAM protein [Streptomyces mirabilis]
MGIDCLVVGHFETPIDELSKRLRPSRSVSGTYGNICINSINLDGQQISYGDFFNRLMSDTSERTAAFNPFASPHAGAMHLAARLHHAGLTAAALHFVSADGHELTDAIRLLEPAALVLTSTFYVEDEPIRRLLGFVRETGADCTTIIGGPYVVARTLKATSGTLEQLCDLGVDYLIADSQGEGSLIALVRKVASEGPHPSDVAEIPNLLFREPSGDVVTTRRIPEREPLKGHPIPWHRLAGQFRPRLAFLRTARGCAFRCAFCNYPSMSGSHDIGDIEYVMAELEDLRAAGITEIAFVDDTFNVPLPRFKKMMREIIQRDFGFHWTSFFRCSNADEETFDLMAEAGCQAVFLGIESGSRDVLKLMNKAARPEAYARGIKALRERDIMSMGSFIIGFPGETSETVRETLEFLTDNPTDFFNVQLYYHDPLAPVESMRDVHEIKGMAYHWKHRTMTWMEASDWVEHVMRSLPGSVPIPLYGFSIWSLPYFNSMGFDSGMFRKFTGIASDAFREGMSGGLTDLSGYRQRFSAVFPDKLLDDAFSAEADSQILTF